MTAVNKYRIRCTTDNTWEYVWAEAEPTTCPTNPAHTINANTIAIVDVAGVEPKQTADGMLMVVPHPQSYTFEVCDRDFKIGTCLKAASVEDLRMNVTTRKEDNWGELVLDDVYKDDAGTMVACTDQADADVNGILSVWNYCALDQTDGTTKTIYDLRDSSLTVDPTLTGRYDHRAYMIAAPDVELASCGQVRLFDGYLGPALDGDGVLGVKLPKAKTMDPAITGGSVIRVYVVHPAGSKLTHALRFVTYRPVGTY